MAHKQMCHVTHIIESPTKRQVVHMCIKFHMSYICISTSICPTHLYQLPYACQGEILYKCQDNHPYECQGLRMRTCRAPEWVICQSISACMAACSSRALAIMSTIVPQPDAPTTFHARDNRCEIIDAVLRWLQEPGPHMSPSHMSPLCLIVPQMSQLWGRCLSPTCRNCGVGGCPPHVATVPNCPPDFATVSDPTVDSPWVVLLRCVRHDRHSADADRCSFEFTACFRD